MLLSRARSKPVALLVCWCLLALQIPAGAVAIPEAFNPAKAQNANHVLRPGDVVRVLVRQGNNPVDATTYTLTITAEGKLFFPLIGELNVEGKTIGELAGLLTAKLDKLVDSPNVQVFLAETRVMIFGSVENPGAYTITGELYLLDLFILAGGPTDEADLDKTVLMRNDRRIVLSNIRKMLHGGDLNGNIALLSGDAIFVPRSAVRVFIHGFVSAPGFRHVPPGTNVADLIQMAGGPTEKANLDKVRLQHQGERVKKLSVRTMLDRGGQSQLVIKDGDVVYVPRRRRPTLGETLGILTLVMQIINLAAILQR